VHNYLLIFGIIAAAIIGFFYFKTGAITIPSIPQNISNHGAEVTPMSGVYEVSLPALARKEFNGRDLKLGIVEFENEKYTRYHITYKSGDLTISGIMNVPKGSGPFPILILNHGYIDPEIYTIGRGLKREQDYLARQGFIVLHPDYRNHAQSDSDPNVELNLRLGYIEDSINAVLAIQNSNLPYVDREKIGMMGHSMGGGVTQGVLVIKPDLVDAAVLYAPVSSDYRDNFRRWLVTRTEVADKITKSYGSPESNSKFWDGISPRTYFDQVNAPVEIHHGTSDSSVPYEWSVRLEKELKDKDKQATLYTYEGEEHEFGPQWQLFMERTAKFFKLNLK
jgi:uncharacterized protein